MGVAQVTESGSAHDLTDDEQQSDGRPIHVDVASSSGSDSSVAIHSAIQAARCLGAQRFGLPVSSAPPSRSRTHTDQQTGSRDTTMLTATSTKQSRGISSAEHSSSRPPTATSSPHQHSSTLEVVGAQHPPRLRRLSAQRPSNNGPAVAPGVVPSAPFDAAVNEAARSRSRSGSVEHAHARHLAATSHPQTQKGKHLRDPNRTQLQLVPGPGTPASSSRSSHHATRLPTAQPHNPASALQQWLDSQRPAAYGGSDSQPSNVA